MPRGEERASFRTGEGEPPRPGSRTPDNPSPAAHGRANRKEPNMSLRSHQFRKPSVYVTESEYERLSNLAHANASRGAALLGDELVRAIVLKDGEFPRDFVRLRSFVAFTDLMTGRTRRVQIVLPDEADIDQ